MTMTADQLEHSAEVHRTHITELLDELRERATPGEVVDDLLGWDVGRQTLRKLGAQVRENPLPLALIGIGVTWLLASDAIGNRRQTNLSANENADPTRFDVLDRAAEGASRTVERARSKFESASGATADAAERASAQSRARSAWERAMNAAGRSGETLSNSRATMSKIMDEQPLLLGGLSFVLGLAAGAALPMTEVENDLFGEMSDETKHKAKAAASESYEDAKHAAQSTIQADGAAANDTNGEHLDGSSPPSSGHISDHERTKEGGIDPSAKP